MRYFASAGGTARLLNFSERNTNRRTPGVSCCAGICRRQPPPRDGSSGWTTGRRFAGPHNSTYTYHHLQPLSPLVRFIIRCADGFRDVVGVTLTARKTRTLLCLAYANAFVTLTLLARVFRAGHYTWDTAEWATYCIRRAATGLDVMVRRGIPFHLGARHAFSGHTYLPRTCCLREHCFHAAVPPRSLGVLSTALFERLDVTPQAPLRPHALGGLRAGICRAYPAQRRSMPSRVYRRRVPRGRTFAIALGSPLLRILHLEPSAHTGTWLPAL